jgi:uncharacterized damage-inducible protein DinB
MVEPLEDPRRVDPPFEADERESLEAWLEYHRTTLLLKCEGLDDEQRKRRPVPTSLMSLHGLVRHMADVERGWFRRTIAGEDAPPIFYDRDANIDGDFDLPADASWDDDLATWRAELDAARAIAAPLGLDDVGVNRRHGEAVSLRWVYLHMIEEYARHNGHADLVRELVDGAVGD